MSSKQEDENYWNRSDFKPFSFDDEEFQLNSKNTTFGGTISTSFVTDIIFEGISTSKPETVRRPLETLISQNSLNQILGGKLSSLTKLSVDEELKLLRRQVKNQWIPPSASKTIKLILTGQPYSLHLYKSLASKKEILNEAIKSGDGAAILTVVLYLSQTLKKSIFYQILQANPIAVSHYVQYLSTRLMVSDVTDVLEMLGLTRDSAMKQFSFIIQGVQNEEIKLQRLSTCYKNHFSLLDCNDKQFVEDYIAYLKWLQSLDSSLKNLPKKSVLSSLSYLCKNHWNEPKTNINSPWYLVAQQNITERQFHWTILTSRASIQSWNDIEAHFLTKGWLNGKKLRGIIPIEKIVVELHRCNAPFDVLNNYFKVIGNLEKRLELAKQLPCHKTVIDTFILMKDRQGIIDHKMNLKLHSEEYLYAENALRNQIKWKN